MTQPSRAGTSFILVTILLDTLGIGLVIPVGPKLVASFLGGDLGAASRYFGVFFALYSAMQFLCSPILGGLSDRFGRRTVILGSLLGATVSYLISALTPVLALLFVGRIIAGITGASFSAATAYIADTTPPEKRAANFGLVGAAFGLGFVIGPVVGGVLGGVNLRLPYLVAAGLNLLNALYGAFVLPESLKPEHRRPFSLARANPFAALRNLGRHREVLGMTVTMLCGYLSQMILQSVWTLYTQGRFHWTTRQVGVSLGLVGIATAAVQGGLIRVVLRRWGERVALLAGLGLGGMSLAALGLAHRPWMLYALIVPLAMGGLSGPATQALLTRVVKPSEQGELQGSLASLSSLASIAGPLLGTGLMAHFATADARPYIPGIAFFAAALCNVVGLVWAARQFARMPEPKAGPT